MIKTFYGNGFNYEYDELEGQHEIQVSLDPEDPYTRYAFFTEEDLVNMLEELRSKK